LLGAILPDFEVLFFQIGHDLAGFRLHGGVNEYKIYTHANDTPVLVLGLGGESGGCTSENKGTNDES
jgi:hypothetical protein